MVKVLTWGAFLLPRLFDWEESLSCFAASAVLARGLK
jgi:hypothetical protein